MDLDLDKHFNYEYVCRKNFCVKDNLLYEKITNCSIDNLLELLINENETSKFTIITCSVTDFTKFEILYNGLCNEIDLMQNNYYLFKCAVLFGDVQLVQFLLQSGFNLAEFLDFALKSIKEISTLVKKSNLKIIKLLLSNGLDLSKVKEQDIVFDSARKNNNYKKQVIEKYNFLVANHNVDPLILLLLFTKSSNKYY